MSEHRHSTDDVHEVDTGSFTISYRVRVGAEPFQLWELIANPHRHHELDGGDNLSDNVSGPEYLSEGDTFNIWMRRFGMRYTLPMRVITADPEREIAWRHPTGSIWRWSFQPVDGPGTWVTETFDYTKVKPIIIRGFTLIDLFEQNALNMRQTLQRLQDRYPIEHA